MAALRSHDFKRFRQVRVNFEHFAGGLCEGLHTRRVLHELCIPTQKLHILTHANAALKSAERLGPGRMLHMAAASLLVKESIGKKEGATNKVDS